MARNEAEKIRDRVSHEAIAWMGQLQVASDESKLDEVWTLEGLRNGKAKSLRLYVRRSGCPKRLYAHIDLATGETRNDLGQIGAVRL